MTSFKLCIFYFNNHTIEFISNVLFLPKAFPVIFLSIFVKQESNYFWQTKGTSSFAHLFSGLCFLCVIICFFTCPKSKISNEYIIVGSETCKFYVTDCMLLSSHIRASEWIQTLQLPECQELLFQSRRKIWSLSDCNWTQNHWTRTQNHLVRKRTLSHLAKLGYVTVVSLLCHSR